MSRRISVVAVLCFVLIAFAFAGCGNDGDGDGGGSNNGFGGCGDGRVSGSEECDDGNQVDEDTCLATCQANVCGDGFTNPAAEACDILPPPSSSCQGEGFAGGTIACNDDCTLDTSGCTGQGGPAPTPTPIPTARPGGGAATPTATAGGPIDPTATPTPSSGGGGSCNAGEPVTVAVSIDASYGAARIDLIYPAGAVNLPGSGTASSVVERVAFAGSGLTTVNDDDNTSTLTASLVSFQEQPAGRFATITFDCVTDVPDPSAFACTVVSASTPGGVGIPDAGCTVAVP